MNHEPMHETWSNVLIPITLILGLVALLMLNPTALTTELNPIAHWLDVAIGYVAVVGDVAATLVIGIAVVRELIAYARVLRQSAPAQAEAHETIRLRLGRALVLGLEFTVASDILATVVSPTRDELIDLGAIILLRSLLNYFLEREMRQVEERRAQ
ncbi:hypothetical protein ANRL1_03703 [Anaerolineae bacterium]|nr:hypothetical protein ANRL1_03703 [Anaerolineae bacterium]